MFLASAVSHLAMRSANWDLSLGKHLSPHKRSPSNGLDLVFTFFLQGIWQRILSLGVAASCSATTIMIVIDCARHVRRRCAHGFAITLSFHHRGSQGSWMLAGLSRCKPPTDAGTKEGRQHLKQRDEERKGFGTFAACNRGGPITGRHRKPLGK